MAGVVNDDNKVKRQCGRCDRLLVLATDFTKNTSKTSGYQSWCKQCNAEVAAKRYVEKGNRKKSPEAYRAADLWSNYRMRPQEYDQMMWEQLGVCAICGQAETAKNKTRLSVDHCHTTGVNRGLLCSTCNLGIGYFKDDVKRLKAAIDYLDSHAPPP